MAVGSYFPFASSSGNTSRNWSLAGRSYHAPSAKSTSGRAGRCVAADVPAVNPMFDVTPADLVDYIVTEKGVVERPDNAKMAQLMCRKRLH